VAKQPADWDQDKGFDVAQNMLQAHPDISVFFGRADAMALGAAQAVRVANVKHKVTIVGFDGDFAGLRAVRDGKVDATMTQQTQRMGRMSVTSALALMHGKQVPKQQLLPAFLTTKANAAKYLASHP
jgi:ribose transport system substrate-binding protein